MCLGYMENDMTEWIKCSERVPDNSRQVLVTASGLIGLTFWIRIINVGGQIAT